MSIPVYPLRLLHTVPQLVDRDDIGKWPRALIIVPTRELCAQVRTMDTSIRKPPCFLCCCVAIATVCMGYNKAHVLCLIRWEFRVARYRSIQSTFGVVMYCFIHIENILCHSVMAILVILTPTGDWHVRAVAARHAHSHRRTVG